MDTEICRVCGGYGDCYVNIGDRENPSYDLKPCNKCHGLGHHPIGGHSYARSKSSAEEAMQLAIQALERHIERERRYAK